MDIDAVLSQFGDKKKRALSEYRRFIMEEFGSGRKPELTGGGLIRSQGGWSTSARLQRSGKKEEADERILGDRRIRPCDHARGGGATAAADKTP